MKWTKKPWHNLEVEINNDKNNYCPRSPSQRPTDLVFIMENDSPQSYMVCMFKCVQMCACECGTAGWRCTAEVDVGQDLHEGAISNRDVAATGKTDGSAGTRCLSCVTDTRVLYQCRFALLVCTCGWEGIEALWIQQECVEQTVNTDNRPPSELASVGDTHVISYGDL